MTVSFEQTFLQKLEAIITASGGSVPAMTNPNNFQQRSLDLLDALAGGLAGGGDGGGSPTWESITGKPQTFPTSWSDISDIPPDLGGSAATGIPTGFADTRTRIERLTLTGPAGTKLTLIRTTWQLPAGSYLVIAKTLVSTANAAGALNLRCSVNGATFPTALDNAGTHGSATEKFVTLHGVLTLEIPSLVSIWLEAETDGSTIEFGYSSDHRFPHRLSVVSTSTLQPVAVQNSATRLLLSFNGDVGQTEVLSDEGHFRTVNGGVLGLTGSAFGNTYLRIPAASSGASFYHDPFMDLSSQDFTVEATVRFTGDGNGYYWPLLYSSDGGFQFMLYRNIYTAKVICWFIDSGGYFRACEGDNVAPTAAPLNTWIDVAVTRNGGVFSFYLNGVRVGQNSSFYQDIRACNADVTWLIGRQTYGQTSSAELQVDSMRVVSNRALYDYPQYSIPTPTERQIIY